MKKNNVMTKAQDMKQDKKLMGKMIKESEKKDLKRDAKMLKVAKAKKGKK